MCICIVDLTVWLLCIQLTPQCFECIILDNYQYPAAGPLWDHRRSPSTGQDFTVVTRMITKVLGRLNMVVDKNQSYLESGGWWLMRLNKNSSYSHSDLHSVTVYTNTTLVHPTHATAYSIHTHSVHIRSTHIHSSHTLYIR